ncbi:MAG TPA: hypothetical protein VIJ68_04745 [Candidatus Saccharimonadales bacterium]
MTEQLRRPGTNEPKRWPNEFVGGHHTFRFGWAIFLKKALRGSPLAESPAVSKGVVAVAIGEHAEDREVIPLSDPPPKKDEIAKALGYFASGVSATPFPDDNKIFKEPFDTLQTSPGIRRIDIVVIGLAGDHGENIVAHSGPTKREDLVAPLSTLADRLWIESGLEIPA